MPSIEDHVPAVHKLQAAAPARLKEPFGQLEHVFDDALLTEENVPGAH